MQNDLQTRRTVIGGMVAAAAATVVGCSTQPSPPPLPGNVRTIIDTHTHFYDPTRPQGVPWPGKNDPFLYRRVMPAEFEALARPLGIGGTVIVEASPWVEDNQFLLDLAKDDPFIVGICGSLPAGTPEFRQQLKRFAKHPLFRGIRLRDDAWRKKLDDREFLDDLRRMADADLQIDVNTGIDGLADVAKLADALPSLRIVLDHCGNTRIDGTPVSAAWLGGMTLLSKRPNLWAKLSGLVEGTGKKDGDAPADVALYRPVLDWMWRLFGEDKLIWGSNWPVSARFASLATVYNLAHDYIANAGGPASVRKVFGGNALVAYKWVMRK
jgi:predicted TIM-barrel fold metal-dependent hydrolase